MSDNKPIQIHLTLPRTHCGVVFYFDLGFVHKRVARLLPEDETVVSFQPRTAAVEQLLKTQIQTEGSPPSVPMCDRARRIVKLAATQTSIPFTKRWLDDDSQGTWERTAQTLLEKTAAKATELELTEQEVDHAIAVELVIYANRAQAPRSKP